MGQHSKNGRSQGKFRPYRRFYLDRHKSHVKGTMRDVGEWPAVQISGGHGKETGGPSHRGHRVAILLGVLAVRVEY